MEAGAVTIQIWNIGGNHFMEYKRNCGATIIIWADMISFSQGYFQSQIQFQNFFNRAVPIYEGYEMSWTDVCHSQTLNTCW